MYNDKIFIGQKIKEFRKKNNMSQAQLAEEVGLSDKHIGRIESGRYVPSCIKFLKILEVLKINPAEFGFDIALEQNKDRANILKLVYSSSNNELKLYLKILNALKESGM